MGFYFGFMRERERGSEFGLEFSVILLDSRKSSGVVEGGSVGHGLEFSVILLDGRKSSGVVEGGSVGHKGIKKYFFLKYLLQYNSNFRIVL